jgi:hypothetical protein
MFKAKKLYIELFFLALLICNTNQSIKDHNFLKKMIEKKFNGSQLVLPNNHGNLLSI